MKHIFIINPVAGKGRASTELLPGVLKTVKEEGIDYEIHRTVNVGDAYRYVRLKCEENAQGEELRFYSCGGDGTMNEVLNGLYGFPNAQLAVIPAGTGNDFIRNFENGKNFRDPLKQIHGVPRNIDAIRYELLDSDGLYDSPHTQIHAEGIPRAGYALNMFNMGFDAQVVAKAAEIKMKPMMGGTAAYIGGVGIVLARLRTLALTVEADGVPVGEGEFLLTGVANGRFSGGGFDGMPVARVDDGLMDLLLVRTMTRRRFLSIIKKYHDGTHLDDPRVDGLLYHYTCKEVVVRPKEKMIIAIDGETSMLGGIRFTICPGSVRFSVPD